MRVSSAPSVDLSLEQQIARVKEARLRMGQTPVGQRVITLPKPAYEPLPSTTQENPMRRVEAAFTAFMKANVTVRWGYGLENRLEQNQQPKAIEIMYAVAKETGVPISDMKGPRRQRHIAAARQYAMWRVRNECPHLSYPQIGRVFGGKDHTTVLHACKKFDRIMGDRK